MRRGVCVCGERCKVQRQVEILNQTFCGLVCFMFSEKMLSTLNKIRKD